ncbi:MAG TPA: hypothetical protein VIM08_12825 [Arthrobacter sp.]
MISRFASPPGATRRTGYRTKVAFSVASAGLALVAAGAWLPWLTVFNGLTLVRGFELDGGYLAGMAVAAAAMLVVAGRLGGSAFLRPLSILGSALVLADSLYSGWRIAGYVANPGPTAGLVMPAAGIGPLVMAAGGLALLLATAVAPISRRRLEAGTGLPLVLSAHCSLPVGSTWSSHPNILLNQCFSASGSSLRASYRSRWQPLLSGARPTVTCPCR